MAATFDPNEILVFWFAGEVRERWFRSTPEFDRALRTRFEPVYRMAARGQLNNWCETAAGALALVIVLDQFPLNMYRGLPESFATEAAARAIADKAIQNGFDRELNDMQKGILYLPFMHSESPADQDRSVQLYERAGLEEGARWARHHREIVQRFGRFPHRNTILGRASTPQELAWLDSDAAFKG